MARPAKPIVVVGSINTDLVVSVPQHPAPGETVAGHRFAMHHGGKGANQAVAAARLEASVAMIGMVGDDDFGRASLQQLRAEGVDCEHVQRCAGRSGVALITVDQRGENCIVVVPGANGGLSPSVLESKRAVIRTAGLVLAQLEIPMDSAIRLSEICEEEGVPLMLDPAPAQTLPPGLLSRCAWFTPNESEATFYAGPGADTPERQVEVLLASGAKNILLKLGARGSHIHRPGAATVITPALPVAVVDTTAAGDTYNAAFAVAMLREEPTSFCATFAGAAAAVAVTRPGAQASMPTLAEVEALLRHSRKR